MPITEEDKIMLETFFQYGDLRNADIVFVGMEEGLGGNTAEVEISARRELFHNQCFNGDREFINGVNSDDGWYINNSACLIKAQRLAKNQSIENIDLTPDYAMSQAMQNQARMHWLLQGNNRTTDYEEYDHEYFKNYKKLNRPNSRSAMIDILPFPNQGGLAEEYQNFFPTRKEYERHYLHEDNIRLRIIKKIYDEFPIPLSINYSGYRKGDFPLRNFFEEQLDFIFGDKKYTSEVNPELIGTPISPSENERPFIIGTRTNKKGSVQKIVLTPFWGNGQIARNDIDVISTWLS
jgi:hypothetical protein